MKKVMKWINDNWNKIVSADLYTILVIEVVLMADAYFDILSSDINVWALMNGRIAVVIGGFLMVYRLLQICVRKLSEKLAEIQRAITVRKVQRSAKKV